MQLQIDGHYFELAPFRSTSANQLNLTSNLNIVAEVLARAFEVEAELPNLKKEIEEDCDADVSSKTGKIIPKDDVRFGCTRR